MKQGSSYYPLFEHLSRSGEREVTLSFAEIETLLGRPLPASARHNAAWWSNRRKGAVQAAAWMEAGYHVVALDLDAECVTFQKPIKAYRAEHQGGAIQWNSDLIKGLRMHMGLTQSELADALGVRQQTISEWEKGIYAPTRASSKHLTRVAEEAGFVYREQHE